MTAKHLLTATLAAAISTTQALAATDSSDLAKAKWQAWTAHEQLREQSLFHGLQWRSIGPTVQGGRVVDVESVPGEPYTFYVSYASGGVWKTINNGVSFEPLTDQLPTTINGDLAVDPSNPKRLWLGTGEPNSSRSSYGGMGVFLSEDAGKTWQSKGLTDTDRIARIVVDPNDGQRVCVASLGKLYSTGGTRGVICTRDGGSNWQHTLKGENAWTGASDLVIDPKNPDVIYAALWERSRSAWNFVEGGKGSGIYKSTDGGLTWNKISKGLPQHDKVGRIGLTIHNNNPQILYASIDNNELLPESQWDMGDRPLSAKRLKSMSKDEFLRQDPDEIERFIRDNDFPVEVDAKSLLEQIKTDKLSLAQLIDKLTDANAGLFSTDIKGLEIYRSNDGGLSWRKTHDEPLREVTYTYGYYFSAIRVAPDNPDQVYAVGVPMIESKDGGKTWSTLQTADVHVDYHAWWIDPNFPKRMIAGNDGGVDMSYDGGKTWVKLDKQPVGQFYTIAVDLAEPYNVYGGLQDNGTYKGSNQTRWELGQEWSFINGGDGMHVAIDTRDNKTIYTGYQFGWYERSDGQEVRPREALDAPPLRYNWNSPVVLSNHNQDVVYFGTNKLFRSMDQGENWTAISGDLTQSKNRGDVPYATITSVSESPKQFGLIWAGTDDGQVQVSENAGQVWRTVSGKLPDAWVSRVMASQFKRERAYLSFNDYRNDSITPYVYVTEDLGASWKSITSNLPQETVNVVREDPVNENVIYVGTDRGVYVSLDRGGAWQTLDANLPNVPVHDLVVHPREREVVIGTHGRSVWIADALPIQDLSASVQDKAVHVFPLSKIKASRGWRSAPSLWFDESPYQPEVKAPYWAKADGEVTIQIKDQNDQVVFETKQAAKRGVNTFVWNVQLERERALAAERHARELAAKTAAEKAKDNKQQASSEGELANQAVAESVRLGHRIMASPGEYQLVIRNANGSDQATLTIEKPEAFKPRKKAEPSIRGKAGWSKTAPAAPANPRARSKG